MYLFWIGGSLLYNVVLVSAKPQHESAIGIPMFPPSWTCLPAPSPSHPSRLSQSPGLSSCVLQQIPTGWLVYTWQCICFSATLSIHPSLSFPPCVHKSALHVWVYCAIQTGSPAPFFQSLHVCIIHDICFWQAFRLFQSLTSTRTAAVNNPTHSWFCLCEYICRINS